MGGFEDLYGEDERAIYVLRVAGRDPVHCDPLELQHKLMVAFAADGIPAALEAAEKTGDEVQLSFAARRLAAAVRSALGLPEVDPATGVGVTTASVLKAYGEWLAWCAGQKKTTPDSPTTSPPTGTLPAACPTGSSSASS